jgi:hypothetical protein
MAGFAHRIGAFHRSQDQPRQRVVARSSWPAPARPMHSLPSLTCHTRVAGRSLEARGKAPTPVHPRHFAAVGQQPMTRGENWLSTARSPMDPLLRCITLEFVAVEHQQAIHPGRVQRHFPYARQTPRPTPRRRCRPVDMRQGPARRGRELLRRPPDHVRHHGDVKRRGSAPDAAATAACARGRTFGRPALLGAAAVDALDAVAGR